MLTNLPGLHGRRGCRVPRQALVSCCALVLGATLAYAGAAPAGAATRPASVKPGSLRLVMPLPSGKTAVRPLSGKRGIRPAFIDLTNVQLLNQGDGYNLCLDAENDDGGNPGQNGDKVQLWTCNSGAAQQHWNINCDDGDYCQYAPIATITSQYGNHLCLDAENDSGSNPSQNGDKVQMWTCSGGENQQWEVYATSNGGYAFQNLYGNGNGLVLGAENDDGGNPSQCGDNVQVQTWDGQHVLYQQTWFDGGNYSQCS